jgi:hypothetical protein
MTTLWTAPTTATETIFNAISNSMKEFTERYESVLPNINTAKNLMCFSDYSGEEENSEYFVYSFLIIDGDNIATWNTERLKLRAELLSDRRRVSYKNYRDKLTQSFVDRYLKIADELNGYLITVSISKDINSMFEGGTPFDKSNPEFAKYGEWTTGTIEKTFRIMHILGLFVAGLSSKYQNLLWVTDNDSIAANKERLTQLTELFGAVASQYLSYSLGHLRVATTQSDDGTRSIEDLCSIADLVAGAYSDQLKTVDHLFNQQPDDTFWIYSPDYKKKTKDLTWWLTTSNKKLCKLCFKINKGEQEKHKVSFYHFHDRE